MTMTRISPRRTAPATGLMLAFLAALLLVVPSMLRAQAWIQIEAHPDLRTAQARAQVWAETFDDVRAFQLGSGWVALVLGPDGRDEATARAASLRGAGLVPRDAYVTEGAEYVRQVWPMDAFDGQPASAVITSSSGPALAQAQDGSAQAGATPTAEERATGQAGAGAGGDPFAHLPDEPLAQARALERAYTAEERRAIQTALAWTGDYTLAIDGAFGPGTRGAISSWQSRFGAEPTGFLTTRQRVALLTSFEEEQARFGMTLLRNAEAGIEVEMPLAMVTFSRIEPPFVHYEPSSDEGIRILLISQEGTRNTLHGLFDVMQTLEMVPLDGPREKRDNSFLLTGRNAAIGSHTVARLTGGTVKGFSVIWPRSADDDAAQIVAAMEASFTPIDGVLDETMGFAERQSVDLLAGLEIRRPTRTGSGFYVDASGRVATSASLVEGCGRVTIENRHEMEASLIDAETGLALLIPRAPLSPPAIARLAVEVPRLREEVALAGYRFGGRLGAPSITLGQLAELEGLGGEPWLKRLALAARPGEEGGPVIDVRGAVVGMLRAADAEGTILPDGVSFALDAPTLAERLRGAGVSISEAMPAEARLAVEDMTAKGREITVLVSCWN